MEDKNNSQQQQQQQQLEKDLKQNSHSKQSSRNNSSSKSRSTNSNKSQNSKISKHSSTHDHKTQSKDRSSKSSSRKNSKSREHSQKRSQGSVNSEKEVEKVPPSQYQQISALLYIKEDECQISKNQLSEMVNEINDKYKPQIFQLNSKIEIPGTPGYCIELVDQDKKLQEKVCDKFIYQFFKLNNHQSQEQKKGQIIILIPQGIVPQLIGKNGKQINKLKEDSQSNIIVNQPIIHFPQRAVNVEGRISHLSRAINMIYSFLSEKAQEVDDLNKQPVPLDPKDSQACTKLLLERYIAFQLRDDKKLKQLRQQLEEDNHVRIELSRWLDNRRSDEYICEIRGVLQNVQDTSVVIIKKCDEICKQETKEDFCARLLIKNSYVTKLIGSGGCMIKQICQNSNGAKIKIFSNKNERSPKKLEKVIRVLGDLDQIEKAVTQIIEQIESFKNGGPILTSGKYMNDSIAEQYINSVNAVNLKMKDGSKIDANNYEQQASHRNSVSQNRGHRKNSSQDRKKSLSSSMYSSNNFSRSRSRSESKNKYKQQQQQQSQQQLQQQQQQQQQQSPQPQHKPKDEENSQTNQKNQQSASRKKSEQSERSSNKMKVPVLVSSDYQKILEDEHYNIVNEIYKKTGCQLTIGVVGKIKCVNLSGTIEQNTEGFKELLIQYKKFQQQNKQN